MTFLVTFERYLSHDTHPSVPADCTSLKEQLTQRELAYQEELEQLTRHTDRLDADRTELKLQVVELQLVRGDLESRLAEGERGWAERERETREEGERERGRYEERLLKLEEAISEVCLYVPSFVIV